MRDRSMLDHYSLRPYRVCPDCGAKYTVDARSKRRRVLIALFALATVGLSVAGFFRGYPWSLASFFAGIGLLAYTGYALSKMIYVSYGD